MAWDGVERRRFKRYGVRSSTVRYGTGGILSSLANLGQKYLILNISEQGFKFITKDPMNAGDKLKLQIEAPTINKTPFKAQGRVVWVMRSQTQDVWHVGVEFTKIKGKYEGILKTLVDSAVLEKVDISTTMYLREIKRL
jgi:hypothetical protein